MLKLWRRHRNDCKYDSREDTRCTCPIFSEWRVNGRRIRKELGTGDWRVAQTRAQQWEIAGVPASGEPISVEVAFDRYLANLEARNLTTSTLRKHKLMKKQLTKFCTERGLMFVGQLDFEQLTQFRAGWKLSPRSASKALERLRSLKFCVKCKWLSENPAQDIDPPKVDDAEVLPFSNEETKKVLKACDTYNGDGARLKALSNFMLHSGLRISDASTISRKAFVKEKGSWSVVLRTLKSGTTVCAPLPSAVAETVLAQDGGISVLDWQGAGQRVLQFGRMPLADCPNRRALTLHPTVGGTPSQRIFWLPASVCRLSAPCWGTANWPLRSGITPVSCLKDRQVSTPKCVKLGHSVGTATNLRLNRQCLCGERVEPRVGVEPTTCRLRIGCSTTELPRLCRRRRGAAHED